MPTKMAGTGSITPLDLRQLNELLTGRLRDRQLCGMVASKYGNDTRLDGPL
jgi:hypothetical protein